jgi:hypothetical protein
MNNARRSGRTPLYNETRTQVIRQLSLEDLNGLAAQQKIAWFRTAKGKDAVCLIVAPWQSRKYGAAIHDSPCTITAHDVQSNVGLNGERVPGFNRYEHRDFDIVGNEVDAAMTKIEMWPLVFDERNVGICAGQAHGVTAC